MHFPFLHGKAEYLFPNTQSFCLCLQSYCPAKRANRFTLEVFFFALFLRERPARTHVLYCDYVATNVEWAASAQDLELDLPDATHYIALFLGRTIVDEVLPPAFLTTVLARMNDDSLGVHIVRSAGACLLFFLAWAQLYQRFPGPQILGAYAPPAFFSVEINTLHR